MLAKFLGKHALILLGLLTLWRLSLHQAFGNLYYWACLLSCALTQNIDFLSSSFPSFSFKQLMRFSACLPYCFLSNSNKLVTERQKVIKKKERKLAWLLLGVMEEKVCYRYVGEHSYRMTHLGESTMVIILYHVGRGEERASEYSSQEVKGTKGANKERDG